MKTKEILQLVGGGAVLLFLGYLLILGVKAFFGFIIDNWLVIAAVIVVIVIIGVYLVRQGKSNG